MDAAGIMQVVAEMTRGEFSTTLGTRDSRYRITWNYAYVDLMILRGGLGMMQSWKGQNGPATERKIESDEQLLEALSGFVGVTVSAIRSHGFHTLKTIKPGDKMACGTRSATVLPAKSVVDSPLDLERVIVDGFVSKFVDWKNDPNNEYYIHGEARNDGSLVVADKVGFLTDAPQSCGPCPDDLDKAIASMESLSTIGELQQLRDKLNERIYDRERNRNDT